MARDPKRLQERVSDNRADPPSREPSRNGPRVGPHSGVPVETLQESRREYSIERQTHDGPHDGRHGDRVLLHKGDDSSYCRAYPQPAIMSSPLNLDILEHLGYPHLAVESVAKAQRVGRVQRAQSGTTALTIRCGQVATTPRPPLIYAPRKTEDERQHPLPLTSVGKSRRSVRSFLTRCVDEVPC